MKSPASAVHLPLPQSFFLECILATRLGKSNRKLKNNTHDTLEGTAHTLKQIIRRQLLGNASILPANT